MPDQSPTPTNTPSLDTLQPLTVVKLPEPDQTYDSVKSAIYAQAKYLYEHGRIPGRLTLSADLYEILNKRLVFKTPAHKEMPHFVTPYGNLLVVPLGSASLEEHCFAIE